MISQKTLSRGIWLDVAAMNAMRTGKGYAMTDDTKVEGSENGANQKVKVLDPTKTPKPGRERYGQLTANERKERGLWISDIAFKAKQEKKANKLRQREWWKMGRADIIKPLSDAVSVDTSLTNEQRAILLGMISNYITESRPYTSSKILRDIGDHYDLWTQHVEVSGKYKPSNKLDSILNRIYATREAHVVIP